MVDLSAKTITPEKLQRLAMDNGIAFATYRLPGTQNSVTMLQWNSAPIRLNSIEDLKNQSGFIFAPFKADSDVPLVFICPDLIARKDLFEESDKKAETVSITEGINPHKYPFYGKTRNFIAEKTEFILQVEEIKKLIARQTLKKVVLSRVHTQTRPSGFDISAFYLELEKRYPDAFVFLVSIPDVGTWTGASPEPLLQIRDNVATTVSLAGTRKASDSDMPWGDKEQKEQGIVTQYIEDVLSKYRVGETKKTGPATFVAGTIEHLKTSFQFPLHYIHSDLAAFLSDLHPTPSICGVPKKEASMIIQETEKHRREYYTGFLGPVNMEGDWNLFVNLRSMKAVGNELEYYLGAGITEGSVAEEEWEETENKMTTLRTIVESL